MYIENSAMRERKKLQEKMKVSDGTIVLRRREGRSGVKMLVEGGNPSECVFNQSRGLHVQRCSLIPSTAILKCTMC